MNHIDPLKDLRDWELAELERAKVAAMAEQIMTPSFPLFNLRLLLLVYKSNFGFRRFWLLLYWKVKFKFCWLWILKKLSRNR